jgi:hypothetical protein
MKSLRYLSTLSLFWGEGCGEYKDALRLVFFVTHYLGFKSRMGGVAPQVPEKWGKYLDASSYLATQSQRNAELMREVAGEFKVKTVRGRKVLGRMD